MVTAMRWFHIINFDDNGDSTTLALGGEDDVTNWLNSVEEWNPDTEKWSAVEAHLEEKRSAFGLVVAPKHLICPL